MGGPDRELHGPGRHAGKIGGGLQLIAAAAPVSGNYKTRNLAAVLASADRHQMGELGKLIGVMVALDESDLHNYSNYRLPLSQQVPNDGDPPRGPDAQSLGVFQQQPRWWGKGTQDERVRQLMDPGTAADLFFTALSRVTGWQKMPPWEAAQAVQRSGTKDGSNYRSRLNEASALLQSTYTQ